MTAPKLYLLTSDEDIHTLSDKLERAFDTGVVSLLQIRRQQTAHVFDLITLYQETEILISLADKYDIPTVINENLELASHFNTGLHLSGTMSVRVAREILGDGVHVGRSCHGDVAVFREAKKQGASYGAMGAMFGTMTKPLAKTVSSETLTRAHKVGLPLCLIGGISLNSMDELRQKVGEIPIDYVAVTTDILHHSPEMVTAKCRAWRRYLETWD
ncbi:MAG: thiamine phosphate synthase [Moraxella equi]|nr:thiamine phosphate synthase [Moraxella equi]